MPDVDRFHGPHPTILSTPTRQTSRAPAIHRLRVRVKELGRDDRYRWLANIARGLWHSYKHAREAIHAPALLRSLPSVRSANSEELTDFVFNRNGGILRPLQNQKELARLLAMIEAAAPQRYVEIGTAKGGTLFLVSHVSRPDATLVSVDLPGGLYGGGYPRWKGALFRRMVKPGQTLHLIRGDSHRDATKAQVEARLGGPADILFIDGDHSYAGVKDDFYRYRDIVRPGGLIVFHDVLRNRFDPDIQVEPFWRELKTAFDCVEIVDDRDQGVYGIGVLRVPGA